MVLRKLKNKEIKEIIDNCAVNGYSITAKDVSFALLTFLIDDVSVCWKSIFTTPSSNADGYCKDEMFKFLIEQIQEHFKEDKVEGDISFEENKQKIIELINETRTAQLRGEIDAKDALKIQADLRCKLNDKFDVKDTSNDQMIIVENKYNAVCPYCNHEVSIQKV